MTSDNATTKGGMGERKRRAASWTAAACLFVVFILIAVGMHTDSFAETDERFYNAISAINSPELTACIIALTQLGSTFMLIGLAATLLLLPKTRKRQGVPVALMLASSAALNTLVKHIFQRERPSILPLVAETTFSFPSGHAMNSLVLYGTLCMLLCAALRLVWQKRAIIACACVLIAAIGLSRVYLGVHYFSDMLAAFALGGALLALSFPIVKWYEKRYKSALPKETTVYGEGHAVKQYTPENLPKSQEQPVGMQTLEAHEFTGSIEQPDDVEIIKVAYAEQSGERQHLFLYLPKDKTQKRPLIVHVPGSGWRRQIIHTEDQRMYRFAQMGFACAKVEYRPSDVATFPAQTLDCKTAIRFLRKKAEAYGIDPDRIALTGDSSGGHTALMVGITGDDELSGELYGEYSCKVSCIVDWYGPTDMTRITEYPSSINHAAPDSPEGYLIGRKSVLEHADEVQKTNPLNYLRQDKPTPPVLIMHGNMDDCVPFNQSVLLYEKLKAMDKEAEFWCVDNGRHGGADFFTPELLDITGEFLRAHTK